MEEDQERTNQPREHVQVQPSRHRSKRPTGQPASCQVEKIGKDQDRSDDAVPVPEQTARSERLVGAVLDPRLEVGQIKVFADVPERVSEHGQRKHDQQDDGSRPPTLWSSLCLPAPRPPPCRRRVPHPACMLHSHHTTRRPRLTSKGPIYDDLDRSWLFCRGSPRVEPFLAEKGTGAHGDGAAKSSKS